MKTAFLFKPHSFVDVITNSSTELFVCDTEKSIETVKEILTKMVNVYDDTLTFEDIFEDPKLYTKKKFEEDKKTTSPEYEWGYEKEENIGSVMIYGTGDNSIPYELFELITHTFNASQHHLG